MDTSTPEASDKYTKWRRFIRLILVVWTFFVLVYVVLAIVFPEKYQIYVASYEIILFAILGAQLMAVNCILLKQLNSLFPSTVQSKFRREKCFLISTLSCFMMSYFVMGFRNLIVFALVTGEDN